MIDCAAKTMITNDNHEFHSKFKTQFSVLLKYLFSVLSLMFFLYGFFPFKYPNNLRPNRSNITGSYLGSRHIDKLAFIVIDALRYDFVLKDNHSYMPFVSSSILNKKACYLTTKAHSPTVTLPRLKAITSGSLSTYTDIVLNFMTTALEDDNFIQIAVSNGLNIVFYGDDTWLKLFPSSFLRSEGTNSFFTFDYYEVDNNVTRHIDDELKKNDWDIIILHYLGLDHIGHTEGPKSSLVQPKLLEMDSIIKKFSDYFEKLEKTKGINTMLIMTGDHGMKDSGSHGGVTYPEVTVPLVSIGHPCLVLPGWPEDYIPLQIDLAPTLSAAFGLPIPVSSMGKLIPSLLYSMPKEEILKTLEMNRLVLDKHKRKSGEDDEISTLKSELEHWLVNNDKNEEVGRNITNKYFKYLNDISQEIVTSNSDFKITNLVVAVVLLWTSLIYFCYALHKQYSPPNRPIHWFFVIGTVLHAVSLLSSSFIEEEHQTWYFLWATFLILALVTVLKSYDFSKTLFFWITLALTHRILRKLNQTGDKWAFLPDIKSYLYSSEGEHWLFYLFILGMGMIFCCALLERSPKSHLITYGFTLLAVILYRITTGNFKLQYLAVYPPSRGFSEVFAFWSGISVFICQTVRNQTQFYLVWLVFSSFLMRPHNIILLPMEVFISKRLNKLFKKTKDTFWNNIAHVWMGYVFYFYQGNGNSLSNVDVAAGFIGIETYNPIYAGIMIASHSFSSHILSFILSPKQYLVLAISRLMPLTLYCTVLLFQLNHLFIWSVFSPKLLFESCTTLLFLLLMVLNELYIAIKNLIQIIK